MQNGHCSLKSHSELLIFYKMYGFGALVVNGRSIRPSTTITEKCSSGYLDFKDARLLALSANECEFLNPEEI